MSELIRRRSFPVPVERRKVGQRSWRFGLLGPPLLLAGLGGACSAARSEAPELGQPASASAAASQVSSARSRGGLASTAAHASVDEGQAAFDTLEPAGAERAVGETQASGEPCLGAVCYRVASVAQALEWVLRSQPAILGIGEGHAQQGACAEPTVQRFEREVLPVLAERGARALVVELISPPAQCQSAVSDVAAVERRVTETQASENKSDYVHLGHAARAHGLVPFILEPDCTAFQSVVSAQDDRIDRMLQLIAEETKTRLLRLFERTRQQSPSPLLLAYGGALHNDLIPRPGREKWSFGPHLRAASEGRYVELDLVVPEQIRDTEAWRNQPWFEPYRAARAAHPSETSALGVDAPLWLIEHAPGAFALFFSGSPKCTLPAAAP